ncbi:hypothetical protein CK489_29155 [Bradyrhizobium sp. UFLA03-84]|uniref:hypothetical protein n=1 Tax=Bradyrhizobium sp. UFLA03-84 TaxID=418599 RepID=UPI000BAE4B1F|nr:hypothetical protein [Bradyrhizobium sp. UFLA03-84]PAY05454.1 hypothetical protein CK489_29155 [Bradyrhizobium sp. UFLA03-84]
MTTFTHRDVPFTLKRRHDDRFEITIEMDGEVANHTARTRLPELARRRAEMLINRRIKRKLKEKIGPA